jgi:hypothetical protein
VGKRPTACRRRYGALLCAGVAGHAHRHWGTEFTKRAIVVRVMALVMMFISICMAIYAAYNFKRRGDMLQ